MDLKADALLVPGSAFAGENEEKPHSPHVTGAGY